MNEDFKKMMSNTVNDSYLNIYVSSIVKGIINIHKLLNNRIKQQEEREEIKKLAETKKKAEEKKPVETKAS